MDIKSPVGNERLVDIERLALEKSPPTETEEEVSVVLSVEVFIRGLQLLGIEIETLEYSM